MTEAAAARPPRKKWFRWLIVALVVANEIRGVIFVGALAGEAYRQGWTPESVAAYIQGN